MKYPIFIAAFLILVLLAAFDTKEFFEEISAVTPSQIEMKQNLPKSTGDGVLEKFETSQNLEKKYPNKQLPNGTKNFNATQNSVPDTHPTLNPIEKRK
ncbi:MAG: hypothetical protein MRZ62_00130 [Brachyspira sp.]|nr:hypothetical protein [Brachyspira sp.]